VEVKGKVIHVQAWKGPEAPRFPIGTWRR